MTMDRFVPYEKLSKRRQREIDRMKRGDWGPLNPVTRKAPDPKAYDRKKSRRWTDDHTPGIFAFWNYAHDQVDGVRDRHCVPGGYGAT